MRKVTTTGKTVEEAIEQALTQLDVTIEQVEITVIEEAKKGFLGIGSKDAVIEAKEIIDPVKEAKTYLQSVITSMGITVNIKENEEEDGIIFELFSDKVAILIGKRGQTLNALEYLTNLVLNRNTTSYQRVFLDAENYRERRKQTLIALAERQAERALKLKRKIYLEPMPAKDRKIIHMALQERTDVRTSSSGHGPHRHIIIFPAK